MARRPGTQLLLLLGLATTVVLAPAPARAQEYGAEVKALDNAFASQVVRIRPGESVEWANEGRSTHNALGDDGSWGSETLEAGDEFEHAFTEPGVYRYHCSFHGAPGVGMTGIVVVGDAPLPGPTGDVGPGYEPVPGGFADTVRVPQEFGTIQEAVDDAEPGGMVLIDRGIYSETVTVTVPYLTIRGVDRNETIIDGGFERANGIQVIEADGVTIQNLTARNHLLNGFYWSGVHGYWGSYLTAYNNGDYGLFAYASDYGQFDHSLASGSPDSGFYIGQCYPCHALITDVIAERNATGFSGTNAGGELAIVNSEWRLNMSGIIPNTLDSELLPPQRDILIAGNYVHDNNNLDAPALALTYPSFGTGILVTGGIDNRVVGNLVEDHETYGILVLPMLDENLWVTSGNEVTQNTVRRSGLADLGLGAPAAGADCFGDNSVTSSAPAALEMLFPCEGFAPFPGGGGSMAPTMNALTKYIDALDGEFPHGNWQTQPAPGPQPQMEGKPADAPPRPAIPGETVPQSYDIRAVSDIVPEAGPETSKELSLMGMPLASSWWSLLLGLYGYILPFVLYAAWVAIAMWDLLRQESATIPHRARWMLIVMIVPFIGPLLYFAFGRSPIPRQLRLMLTAGGVVVYAVFLVLGALLGG